MQSKAWQSLLHLLSNFLELFRRYKDEAVGRAKALKEVEDANQEQREKIRSIRDDESILDFLLHPEERTPERLRELRSRISDARGNTAARSRKLREIAKNNEIYEKTTK